MSVAWLGGRVQLLVVHSTSFVRMQVHVVVLLSWYTLACLQPDHSTWPQQRATWLSSDIALQWLLRIILATVQACPRHGNPSLSHHLPSLAAWVLQPVTYVNCILQRACKQQCCQLELYPSLSWLAHQSPSSRIWAKHTQQQNNSPLRL